MSALLSLLGNVAASIGKIVASNSAAAMSAVLIAAVLVFLASSGFAAQIVFRFEERFSG